MTFIEEILEIEKSSNNSVLEARQNSEKKLEKFEAEKINDLSSLSVGFQAKKLEELNKQNKELESEKVRSQKRIEKDLEELGSKISSKKKEAVDYVVSQILD